MKKVMFQTAYILGNDLKEGQIIEGENLNVFVSPNYANYYKVSNNEDSKIYEVSLLSNTLNASEYDKLTKVVGENQGMFTRTKVSVIKEYTEGISAFDFSLQYRFKATKKLVERVMNDFSKIDWSDITKNEF